MTLATQTNVLRYILKSLVRDLEKRELGINFFTFKQQNEPFNIINKIWVEKNDPLLFW